MAHFAELDGDNKVLRVCVVDNAHVPSDKHADGETWCTNFWGGTWKQTSYNDNFRKQFAGIGFSYDASKDVHFMVGRRTNDSRGFYNTAVYNASTSKMDLSVNRDFSLAYTGSNPDHADLQGMADFQLTYMPDQQKHLFTWRGNNSGTSFSSGNRYGYYMVGEAQGTSNNTSATILFATGNAKANWTTTDYDARYARVRSFANYAIFIPHHYGATGSNKQISCRILQFAGTDASTENFIGFSDGTSYTNGQTVTVNVTGNTTTQSSLTAGEKYYIQNDGTLSTTAV